jgi:hypothetical protein
MDNDQQRLVMASKGLAAALRRMAPPSLKVFLDFEAEDDENGGWSTDIAEWKGHDVGVAMAVDKFTTAAHRAFWSKRYASIENCSSISLKSSGRATRHCCTRTQSQ